MNNDQPSLNRRPADTRPTAKRRVSMNGQGTHAASRPTVPSSEQRTSKPSGQGPSRAKPSSFSPKNGASRPRTAGHAPNRKTSRPAASPKTPASRRPAPRKRERDEDQGGSTLITSLLKAVIYIIAVLVVSGVLAYYIISIGNDAFAFVKDSESIQLTITEGTTVKDLGNLLATNGIIQYPKIFNYYVGIRYSKTPEFVAGDYTVSPSMSYDKLVATFAKSEKPKKVTVIVSIPEGYTVKQIIDTLVNKYGLSSEEELTKAIQYADFDYWFIDELEKEQAQKPFRFEKRKYRLEGYLYPDTYYYYSDASAETIINKMLKNFDTKMKHTFKNCLADGNTYQEKILNLCAEKGRSFDEMVTLASMVQMEAKYDIEYGNISSVFHNRLNNPSKTNGKLESDATIQYILDKRNPDLGSNELNIDDPYNTYLYQGLPPGPISNPTFLALNYALYPADSNYFYFVAKPDGFSLFAKTYAEHKKNIQDIEEMMKDS